MSIFERLTDQILVAGRVLLVFLQVVKEFVDIGTEALDCPGRRNEAVDSHAPIISSPEVPGFASYGDRTDRGPDGIDITISCQPAAALSVGLPPIPPVQVLGNSPNHEFIIATAIHMVWVGSGEDIICNIGTDILVVIVPCQRGPHAADGANLLALCDLPTQIGIGLHIVGRSFPCPGRVPLYAVVGSAV